MPGITRSSVDGPPSSRIPSRPMVPIRHDQVVMYDCTTKFYFVIVSMLLSLKLVPKSHEFVDKTHRRCYNVFWRL